MKINKVALLLCVCLAFGASCSKKENWETYPANKPANGNGSFEKNLPADFQMPTDDVGKRLLKEYGALFVAKGETTAPRTVIFKDDAAVSAFQSGLKSSLEKIGAFNIELQTSAMNALKEAIAEAKQSNLTITPRAADSAKRTYGETVTLWASRVDPGLEHWVSTGKLQKTEAAKIKKLSPFEQVSEIFKLEDQGMFFAKSLDKSIIYSVAPPGTSQHLSLLALDINEHDKKQVRDILAKHGWFQTVVSDLPHFTYLGVKESDLQGLGLKKSSDGDRVFWIPAM
ncbi:hypothetical protein BH10ACI1_BH10ACI1_32480 [soil metagenome]